MAKNAYLIISDLHDFCKSPDNRIDYAGEIREIKNHVLELGASYKDRGYNVMAILLGDVNNRSYTSVNAAVLNNNYWIAASKLFKDIYTVVGNHELTYYSSNPFFTLVSEIDSVKLQLLQGKVWEPIGIFKIFKIVDTITDGDVIFHFNHYDCPITVPENNNFNVGLFHTEFIFNEIAQSSEDTYHMGAFIRNGITAQNNELLDTYDLCFFGHHHKIYGCWNIETNLKHKCTVYHLASLGRTNVTEIDDNFLERDIPAVIVEDGKFVGVEDNKFMLRSRVECVREDVVELNKLSYARTKALQVTQDYVPTKDSPVDNIKEFCTGNNHLLTIFSDLIESDRDRLSIALEREIRGGI